LPATIWSSACRLHTRRLAHRVLILADGGAGQRFFGDRVEFMKSVTKIDNQPTAYVCENFVCQLPTTDLKTVANLLTRSPSNKAEISR